MQLEKRNTRLILFFGVLAVTSSSFIIRFASQPSYALAWTRVLLTGFISFFVINNNYSLNDITRLDWIKILLASLSLATHFGWWFDSLNYLPISTSLSLTNTAPVWMAIFLFVFFSKSIKLRQKISILFVISGSIVLFLENYNLDSQKTYGLLLALGSAIGFAIYLILAREMVPKFGLWKYFGLVNLGTASILFGWILSNGEISAISHRLLWIFGLFLAIIPGIFGHAVYNWSMPQLEEIDVGVATLGEPILGTIFAWIIFDEILTNYQIIGGIFLIIAIGFSLEFSSKNEKKNQPINEKIT